MDDYIFSTILPKSPELGAGCFELGVWSSYLNIER